MVLVAIIAIDAGTFSRSLRDAAEILGLEGSRASRGRSGVPRRAAAASDKLPKRAYRDTVQLY
jgi:hypothetical protein